MLNTDLLPEKRGKEKKEKTRKGKKRNWKENRRKQNERTEKSSLTQTEHRWRVNHMV
jgi:hypothetical protein